MGYSKDIYDAADRILLKRHKAAEADAAARKAAFYQSCPEAEKIESLLSTTAIAAARTILSGGNAKEQLTKLKKNNQALQERLRLLKRNNLFTINLPVRVMEWQVAELVPLFSVISRE